MTIQTETLTTLGLPKPKSSFFSKAAAVSDAGAGAAAPVPIDLRAQAVMKRAFSFIPPMPPTPQKKGRKRVLRTDIFQGESLEKSVGHSKFQVPSQVAQYIYDNGFYTTQSGRKQQCIKQPPQSQSCGSAAALMLLTHCLETDSELSISDTFWNWYLVARLTSTSAIMQALQTHTNLTERGYTAHGVFYHNQELIDDHSCKKPEITYSGIENHQEALLETLKSVMSASGAPIILSITNPYIDGHWVVLDEILDSGYVHLRDPFTGNAYKILNEELYENWPSEDEVTILYLTKESESGSA